MTHTERSEYFEKNGYTLAVVVTTSKSDVRTEEYVNFIVHRNFNEYYPEICIVDDFLLDSEKDVELRMRVEQEVSLSESEYKEMKKCIDEASDAIEYFKNKIKEYELLYRKRN